MAKQRKIAYGIAEDGISLKLASLTREGSQISLQALDQIELSRSLHQHQDKEALEVEVSAPEDINLDDFTAENLTAYKVQPYETFFQAYSLNHGILAINAFEEQIIKLPVNSPDQSNKQKTRLIKNNIPRSEYREGHWQSSVITINDQSELWIHHGANRLLEILEATASSYKVKHYYQLADANESALANLFLLNQQPDSNETYIILYLGVDYRRALLFEGNKWTFSLPIHVSQHEPDIDIIYSKLSLALDEAHITDPKNLLICGDMCNEESVVFLRNQLPNTNVDMWQLPGLYLDDGASQVYDAAMVARFVLPIALAWKALTMEHTIHIKSNFLPYYIIEGQKVFKIAWHGYIILALIFLSSLYLTKTTFQLQFDLQQENMKNKELYADYKTKKSQSETMMTMAKAIDIQSANIEVIKTLLAGKNQWTELITRLNDSFRTHPTSWITNLRKNGDGFQITGITTRRANIVIFSNLFPNGSINKVNRKSIRNFEIWEFEINYAYPEVNWYQMMEADAELLKKYQAKQTDKTPENAKQETIAGKEGKTASVISQKAETIKQAVSQKDKSADAPALAIDFPVPPKNLLSDNNDPVVKSYKDLISAFNDHSDWQMIDLGVKFINNYPRHPLASYVRWYLSYRSWQNKQYDKPINWLDPIFKNPDATKPYTLLLLGAIYHDKGDKKSSDYYWQMIIDNYPQHQCAKTARKLLNEKR
jgi:hypothetical protein